MSKDGHMCGPEATGQPLLWCSQNINHVNGKDIYDVQGIYKDLDLIGNIFSTILTQGPTELYIHEFVGYKLGFGLVQPQNVGNKKK